MGGHDAPLMLVAGSDTEMRCAVRITVVLALLAILAGGGGSGIKTTGCFLLLAAWVAAEARMRVSAEGRAVLFPDGRCLLRDEPWVTTGRSWLSRRYCVLVCRSGRRSTRILISASKQKAGEYRKLRCWARLGRGMNSSDIQ
ncbi:MAG: hypothetical protein GWM87_01600 [Xanthomonadales bacterium]|nr:hypothetical protein [Xanthomonadales bacterium]NIX11777.1 hypothetical protein [Xanthomonadales bacterium]